MAKESSSTGPIQHWLTAYGGFNISMTPLFSATAALWVESGGVFALPNLRGGGEFGEEWHRAGMLEKKQNVFDDFIAAAEWLIAHGYTTPQNWRFPAAAMAACWSARPSRSARICLRPSCAACRCWTCSAIKTSSSPGSGCPNTVRRRTPGNSPRCVPTRPTTTSNPEPSTRRHVRDAGLRHPRGTVARPKNVRVAAGREWLRQADPRPNLACEISADVVVAARAGEGGTTLEAAAAQKLAAGALSPGLTQANVAARETLITALQDSLAAVSTRSGDLCLIIPDAATRIMLLDFDTLPDKQREADAVVRFRLKKSLPLRRDQSSVSFDRQGTSNPVRVVAAVTPRAQVRETVDAQDGDLANAREHRHDHGVGNAEAAQQQAASAHCPGRGLENLELRIGARELRVFEANQVGETLL